MKLISDGTEPGIRAAVAWLERHGIRRPGLPTLST
jgi:hypothetical protein